MTELFNFIQCFLEGSWKVLSPTRNETSYSDRRFWFSYILSIIIIGGILVLFIYLYIYKRLWWSRGSVLAFSTQVRGFKPGRSTPSFGGEVKPSVPCHRFAACIRYLNGVEVVISEKLPDDILAHSSYFRRWDLSRHGGRGGTWWWKVGTSKKQGKAMASYP
jgi:hypothetical protein